MGVKVSVAFPFVPFELDLAGIQTVWPKVQPGDEGRHHPGGVDDATEDSRIGLLKAIQEGGEVAGVRPERNIVVYLADLLDPGRGAGVMEMINLPILESRGDVVS